MARLIQAQVQHLQGYVDSLLGAMQLDGWVVRVSDQTADDDNHAEVLIVEGQRRADIFFDESFLSEPLDVQRHFTIHELLHIKLRGLRDAASTVKGIVGKRAWEVFQSTHDLAEENATDDLATVLAPMLPLPKPFKGEVLDLPQAQPTEPVAAHAAKRSTGRVRKPKAAKR